MEFDRRDIPMNKLVVTGLESKFTVFDMRTQHPTKGFASLTENVCFTDLGLTLQKSPSPSSLSLLSQAHKSSTLWCVSHLPQNRDIFMTSGAGLLHLWK